MLKDTLEEKNRRQYIYITQIMKNTDKKTYKKLQELSYDRKEWKATENKFKS